jgi:hypothetical protein
MTDDRSPPDRDPIAPTSPHDGGPLKRHRAAVTNDPFAARMSIRTARGRRVRDLFEGYLSRVATDADIVTKAHCLRVAELTGSPRRPGPVSDCADKGARQLQNIRLGAAAANPLSRSRNQRADEDG